MRHTRTPVTPFSVTVIDTNFLPGIRARAFAMLDESPPAVLPGTKKEWPTSSWANGYFPLTPNPLGIGLSLSIVNVVLFLSVVEPKNQAVFCCSFNFQVIVFGEFRPELFLGFGPVRRKEDFRSFLGWQPAMGMPVAPPQINKVFGSV
jgi:hypothetical protein